MMIKKHISIIVVSILLLVVSFACVESGGTNPNDNITIKINWPKTGDSVEVGENIIQYEVTNPANKSIKEFFVIINDGEFSEAFDASGNTNETELLLNVDSVYLNKKIKYLIQIHLNSTVDEWANTSSPQTDIYVGESTSPPSGGDITLTLKKFSGGDQTTFNALLDWTDTLKNVDEYELWRSEGSNNNYGGKAYKTLPSTTERIEEFNLSYFQIYYYKIRAINKYGQSKFSNEVSTADDPDAAPTNLIAEAIGASKIKLTWVDNAIPKIGYRIERSSFDSNGFEFLAYIPGAHKEYVDDYQLSKSTTYCYRVQSVTNSNSSAWSETACADTWAEDVEPPQYLDAVFNQTSRSVVITWKDISGGSATGTVVERSDDNGSTFIKIGTVAQGVETLSDTYESGNPLSIKELSSYVYRAYHTAGSDLKTDYSNEDNVSIPVFLPFPPTNLQKTYSTNSNFTLVWDWNDDIEINRFVVQNYLSPFAVAGDNALDYAIVDPNGAHIYSGDQPTNPVERTFIVRAVRIVEGKQYFSEILVDSTNSNIVLNTANNNEIITLTRLTDNATINITYAAQDGISPNYYQIEKASSYSQSLEYKVIAYLPYTNRSIDFADPDGSTIGVSYRIRAVYFVSGSSTQYYSPDYKL